MYGGPLINENLAYNDYVAGHLKTIRNIEM